MSLPESQEIALKTSENYCCCCKNHPDNEVCSLATMEAHHIIMPGTRVHHLFSRESGREIGVIQEMNLLIARIYVSLGVMQ